MALGAMPASLSQDGAMSLAADTSSEYQLSDRDFSRIAQVVKCETGIVLGAHKRNLVYGRLAKRLRFLGFSDFSDYVAMVEAPEGLVELREMLNAITTNLTAFFRESHHFQMLEQDILPGLMKSRMSEGGRVRLWSSACSSGEEAYSIAMAVSAVLPMAPRCDVKILATDIDTNMVSVAQAGVYDAKRIEAIPPRFRLRHVTEADGDQGRMSDELKALITFKSLNLFDKWPMRGPFDVIFCRNVMIYFDKPSQDALFNRFADYLPVGGILMIGHSETVPASNTRLVRCGRTAYRRVA
jgi:chemotaxis protein methyltransferase CheR